MIWKKSLISFTIFSVMFIGAWYENNANKRVYKDSSLSIEDLMIQESILSTNNQIQTANSLEGPVLAPFKSREYIRIVSQPTF